MLKLPLLLALLAPPVDLPAGQATPPAAVDRSIERCPEFRDEAGVVRVIECVFVDSGELAVLDGDVYLYGRYCLDVANLPIPPCAVGRGNQAAAVFVRRKGDAGLNVITTTVAIGGQIRRPSIVANRYGHVLELPTILSATCDCNASRYFLKRPGTRQWREVDFGSWQGELMGRLPEGLSNWDTPWPDLTSMRVIGALWLRSDSHAGPNGGWFSGELAIEGNRFVLKALEVTRGDVNVITAAPFRWAPEP